MTGFWTDAREAELRQHHADGLTGGEIERAMGAPSRNSVVGKLHRLGLKRENRIEERINRVRRGIAGAKQAPRPRASPRPRFNAPPIIKAPARPAAPAPTAGSRRPVWKMFSIFELSDDRCKWPCACDVNHPGFHFCGGPAVKDLPYCDAHCRIAYRRPGEREEAA